MAKSETRPPSIACIGIIGREDQPLHIALFPPYAHQQAGRASDDHLSASSPPATSYVDFSFILHSSLDVFSLRARDRTRVDQDLGLLHAVDERLSVWGWETLTGTKFVIVLDAWGRSDVGDGESSLPSSLGGGGIAWGMKDGDLKSAFKSLQTAYIRLLQNPFYKPDEHTPAGFSLGPKRSGMIKSKKFTNEVNRIGMTWRPGMKTV